MYFLGGIYKVTETSIGTKHFIEKHNKKITFSLSITDISYHSEWIRTWYPKAVYAFFWGEFTRLLRQVLESNILREETFAGKNFLGFNFAIKI